MASVRVMIDGKLVKNGGDIMKLCSGLYDVADGKIVGSTPFERELLDQKRELVESTKQTYQTLINMSKDDVRKEIKSTYERNRKYATSIIKEMRTLNSKVRFALSQIKRFRPDTDELKVIKEASIKAANSPRCGIYSEDDFEFYKSILDEPLDLSDAAVEQRFNVVLSNAKTNIELAQKELDTYTETLAKRQVIRDQLEKALKGITFSYKTLNYHGIRKRW